MYQRVTVLLKYAAAYSKVKGTSTQKIMFRKNLPTFPRPPPSHPLSFPPHLLPTPSPSHPHLLPTPSPSHPIPITHSPYHPLSFTPPSPSPLSFPPSPSPLLPTPLPFPPLSFPPTPSLSNPLLPTQSLYFHLSPSHPVPLFPPLSFPPSPSISTSLLPTNSLSFPPLPPHSFTPPPLLPNLPCLLFRRWGEVPSRGGVHGDSL